MEVGSHLYSAFLKVCATAGTPQLLDLGRAVYHDLHCHWDTLYSGSSVSQPEQQCVSISPRARHASPLSRLLISLSFAPECGKALALTTL